MDVLKLLKAEELSNEVFGGSKRMSVVKLYRLAIKREIPSIQIGGRWFFPVDEIREWIKAGCKVEAGPEVLETYGRDSQKSKFGKLRRVAV